MGGRGEVTNVQLPKCSGRHIIICTRIAAIATVHQGIYLAVNETNTMNSFMDHTNVGNSAEESDEEEDAFPNTTIQLQHVEGDRLATTCRFHYQCYTSGTQWQGNGVLAESSNLS